MLKGFDIAEWVLAERKRNGPRFEWLTVDVIAALIYLIYYIATNLSQSLVLLKTKL